MARRTTRRKENQVTSEQALWRTLQRAAARFISPSGQWRHECRHSTLKRAPQGFVSELGADALLPQPRLQVRLLGIGCIVPHFELPRRRVVRRHHEAHLL